MIGHNGDERTEKLEDALDPMRHVYGIHNSVNPGSELAKMNSIFLSKMLATLVVKEVLTIDEAKQIASAHDIIDEAK